MNKKLKIILSRIVLVLITSCSDSNTYDDASLTIHNYILFNHADPGENCLLVYSKQIDSVKIELLNLNDKLRKDSVFQTKVFNIIQDSLFIYNLDAKRKFVGFYLYECKFRLINEFKNKNEVTGTYIAYFVLNGNKKTVIYQTKLLKNKY